MTDEDDFSKVLRQKIAAVLDKIPSPATQKKNGQMYINKEWVLDEDFQPSAEPEDQAINHELVLISHYVLGRDAPSEKRGQSKMDIGKARGKLLALYTEIGVDQPRAKVDEFFENVKKAVFPNGPVSEKE